MAEILPSILSADFARLGDQLGVLEQAGCRMVHVDVMDGHFVPNITLGPPVVSSLRKATRMKLDVHLMISPIDPYIRGFADAGADILTVHPEAGPHLHRTLQAIRALGKKPGVVLNPGTHESAVELGILMETTAPHLTRPLPSVIPLAAGVSRPLGALAGAGFVEIGRAHV